MARPGVGKGFLGLSATLGVVCIFAGIRVMHSRRGRCRAVFWFFRWHPRDVIGLQALHVCGAAPTFLCRRKEK